MSGEVKRGKESYIASPNAVILCIDKMEKPNTIGRYYTSYSPEPVSFNCYENLVLSMDEFYNSVNFPHSGTNERTFKGAADMSNRKTEMPVEKTVADEELLRQHGELGTFIIRVQHRQNSTWQGRITWTEEDKTVSFRSVWEMMKLIEDAVGTGEQDKTWDTEAAKSADAAEADKK